MRTRFRLGHIYARRADLRIAGRSRLLQNDALIRRVAVRRVFSPISRLRPRRVGCCAEIVV